MTTHPPQTDAWASAWASRPVPRGTGDRLRGYVTVLLEWQPRINLIAPSTVSQVWERHVADGLQLWEHIPCPTPVIIDMGSGAGFPGMVLALSGAGHVHLVESDQRKAAFLHHVAHVCQAPVTVHAKRIEECTLPAPDIITARALAPLPTLMRWAAPYHAAHTIGIFPKGVAATQIGKAGNTLETIDADQLARYGAACYPSRTADGGQMIVVTRF